MVTITRELAERLLEAHMVAYGTDLPEYKGLSAALSAPDKPLTAEECRAFAKRVGDLDGLVLRGARDELRTMLANFASSLADYEDWQADIREPAWKKQATPEDATQT